MFFWPELHKVCILHFANPTKAQTHWTNIITTNNSKGDIDKNEENY